MYHVNPCATVGGDGESGTGDSKFDRHVTRGGVRRILKGCPRLYHSRSLVEKVPYASDCYL